MIRYWYPQLCERGIRSWFQLWEMGKGANTQSRGSNHHSTLPLSFLSSFYTLMWISYPPMTYLSHLQLPKPHCKKTKNKKQKKHQFLSTERHKQAESKIMTIPFECLRQVQLQLSDSALGSKIRISQQHQNEISRTKRSLKKNPTERKFNEEIEKWMIEDDDYVRASWQAKRAPGDRPTAPTSSSTSLPTHHRPRFPWKPLLQSWCVKWSTPRLPQSHAMIDVQHNY